MLVVLLAVGCFAMQPQSARAETPAPAKTTKQAETPGPPTLPTVFGDRYVAPGGFESAADKLADDPLLHPKRTEARWVARDLKKPDQKPSAIGEWFGMALAVIFESGLWIALGIVVLVLLLTSKQWVPWLRDAVVRPPAPPSPIDVAPVEAHDALPDDITGAARAFWREGQRRRALALIYRAAVEAMVARTGGFLVPGATEAECLRASRALAHAEDREVFASAVRTWQYAAYADRMPDADAFEALLARLSQRFGWAA
jgi:hypothetical protein